MVFCISDACAVEFRQLPGLLVETSAEPTEKSLMELLRFHRGSLTLGRWHSDRPPGRKIVRLFCRAEFRRLQTTMVCSLLEHENGSLRAHRNSLTIPLRRQPKS